jgi:hypothetical protein
VATGDAALKAGKLELARTAIIKLDRKRMLVFLPSSPVGAGCHLPCGACSNAGPKCDFSLAFERKSTFKKIKKSTAIAQKMVCRKGQK